MYGGGVFKMFAVQETKVTENFKKLRQDQRNCQFMETFEDCMNKHLIKNIMENCNCLPYELSDFSVKITSSNDSLETQLSIVDSTLPK